MKKPSYRVVIAIAATLLAGAFGVIRQSGGLAQDKESQDLRGKVKVFMRSKLTNSQNVVEGLATENWDLMEGAAARMLVMSKAAEWSVGDTGEQYKQDTKEFVNACKQLLTQSKAKNLEGATLAYLQLTMNCVECHKHVRAARHKDEHSSLEPIRQHK